jgi:hypothetical protein
VYSDSAYHFAQRHLFTSCILGKERTINLKHLYSCGVAMKLSERFYCKPHTRTLTVYWQGSPLKYSPWAAIHLAQRCCHSWKHFCISCCGTAFSAIVTFFGCLQYPEIFVPSFLLSLAPQLNLGLGFLHKIRLNFLEASQQFSFLQYRVVSPTPNPYPGGPGLCIYIPQRQGGYPF